MRERGVGVSFSNVQPPVRYRFRRVGGGGSTGGLRGPTRRGAARRLDWLLVAATVLPCSCGCLSVYAATRNGPLGGAHGTAYLYRDLAGIGVGLLLVGVGALVDYQSLPALGLGPHVVACLLLAAVLSPLGSTINGARAWFSLGPVQLEPSELVRLTMALALAAVLGRARRSWWRSECARGDRPVHRPPGPPAHPGRRCGQAGRVVRRVAVPRGVRHQRVHDAAGRGSAS